MTAGRRARSWATTRWEPDQVPGPHWVALFRSAPRPVQQAVLAVRRRAPGRNVRWGNLRRTHPFSGRYGYDRGTPVDRYYIEQFLDQHTTRIRGNVLEVKDASYTRRFGDGARCHVIDIDGENPEADLHADLNSPESLPAAFFDCVILTQVLQFLSPEEALGNVWASVAPGGMLLLTVPSLGRLDPHDHATDFWRWTPNGLAQLLGRVGIPAHVSGYGNVLACVSALWGLSVQDLSAEELDVTDPRFPLVACAYAEKPAEPRGCP
jgi:SAM-dependent methyltransferase